MVEQLKQNITEAVTFPNDRGAVLFGILHPPEKISNGTGIIIISPGIKSRVAPHRLYVKMARRFASAGYHVLRVDPEGLGDSEGEIDEQWTADVYGSIEIGLLIDDTITAINWLIETTGVEKVILAGLCGGAITALLTGCRDDRVDAVLSLGMTSILASTNLDPAKYITTGQLQSLREKYLKKILDPRSWKRFLSLQTDYRMIVKSLVQPTLTKITSAAKKPPSTTPDEVVVPEDTNLNPHFAKAFIDFTSRRRILLIFSETDRLYWEFEEKFMQYYQDSIKQHSDNYDIYIVKDANHIFSFSEWQDAMLDKSCQWLSSLRLRAN
jgi:uncharacterized protein